MQKTITKDTIRIWILLGTKIVPALQEISEVLRANGREGDADWFHPANADDSLRELIEGRLTAAELAIHKQP